MSEIDKMARGLLAAEYDKESYGGVMAALLRNGQDESWLGEVPAIRALRRAIMTAPPGWKMAPIPPTDEMIDAAEDAHMPFGDMHFAITSAILAAPEPK